MGIQNYYAVASHITDDLTELNYRIHRTLHNRLKGIRKEATFQDLTKSLQKRYNGYECKLYKIKNMALAPIHAQRCKINLNFSQQTICNYTTEGRNKIHQNLKAINKQMLTIVMKQFIPQRSIEYNDNRISRFIAQYGKCAVSGVELSFNDWHCHHKTPYYLSQDDSYGNLIIVHESIHRLIHLKDLEKIKVLMKVLHLDKKQLKKINELREQFLNEAI